jgi:hypothetical protein
MMRWQLLLIFFIVQPIQAQAPSLNVLWYKPFTFFPPLKNHASVTLYGRTNPGFSISVDKNAIVSEDPSLLENILQLTKQDALSSNADSEGYFQLTMSLPMGLVQVPIKFMDSDGNDTIYVVSLQVDKEKITASLPTQSDDARIARWRAEIKQFAEKKYGIGVALAKKLKGIWFSIGAGITFQRHSQTLGSETDIKFQSLDLPSLGVRGVHAGEKWMFAGEYKYQPGRVSSISRPFTMSDREFEWSTFSLEGGRNWKNDYFGQRARFTYLLGVQNHQLPFFQVQAGNEIAIKKLVITNFSLGGMFTLELTPRIWFETYMRYQLPYSSSLQTSASNVSIDPNFAFDGSVGMLFERRKNQYIGLNWLGQWHSYNFVSRDDIDLSETRGDQSLFYSNLDIRYIWRF